MSTEPHSAAQSATSVPPDAPQRNLAVSQADDPNLPHISLVGDTYTTLLSGKDTADRFCMIDMHVPPGGGPPPHRHDFEESFVVLEGEIETIFRGAKSVVTAGKTIHIPANAPHQFRNASEKPARFSAFALPRARKNSSRKWASRSPPVPRLRPNSTKKLKHNS
jgi:quercetin dioxygenase-like cupin family protein